MTENTMSNEIKLPPMPLAFFDEFGNGADDRVQDYAREAVRLNMPPGWKLVPVEATDEMVKVGDQKTWVFPSRECWAAMLSAAPAAPQPAQQEPSEAERVCAEAYAVVGCLLSDLGLLETEQASKILDNLWAARIVHHDVLPWRSYESHCISEKPQEKRPDRWCSKNECRMIGGCSRKPIQVAQHQEQPQQERKPLTESAIQQIGLDMPSLLHPGGLIEFARAIERAHGITED